MTAEQGTANPSVTRCSCGRFVSMKGGPACWAVKPAATHRQVAGDEWNYFARWRCGACRLDRVGTLSFLRPSTLDEVMRMRGPGHHPPALPDEVPYRLGTEPG